MVDGLGSPPRPLRRRGCRSQRDLRTAEDHNLVRCERAAADPKDDLAETGILAVVLRAYVPKTIRATCRDAGQVARGAKANVDRAQISGSYGDAHGVAVDTLYRRAGDDQRVLAT